MKLIDFKSLGPAKGINYSREHLRRKCKAGEFPEPIPLADRARSRSRCAPRPGEALPRIAAKEFVADVVADPDPPGDFLQANVTAPKAITTHYSRLLPSLIRNSGAL